MSKSRSFRRLAAAAVVAAACCAPASVRAEDAPGGAPGMPTPPTKFTGPFSDFLVGSWTIAGKAGPNEVKGVSTWSRACNGVALVEEMRTGTGESAFYGLGVNTVAADGKAVTTTWFDSDGGADAWVFTGTLKDDGWDLEGELGGGKVSLSFHKKGDTVVSRMYAGDMTMFELTYTKAAAPAGDLGAHPTKAVKHAFTDAMLGAWDYVGEMDMGGQKLAYTGVVTWRAACGGTAIVAVIDSDMGPLGKTVGFAVAKVDVAAKVMKFWGWNDHRPAGRMTGPVTDTTWEGTSVTPTEFGDVKMSWKKTDAGFAADISVGPMKGTETHTKRK